MVTDHWWSLGSFYWLVGVCIRLISKGCLRCAFKTLDLHFFGPKSWSACLEEKTEVRLHDYRNIADKFTRWRNIVLVQLKMLEDYQRWIKNSFYWARPGNQTTVLSTAKILNQTCQSFGLYPIRLIVGITVTESKNSSQKPMICGVTVVSDSSRCSGR